MKKITLSFFLILFACKSNAQALDPAFGTGGIVKTELSNGYAGAYAFYDGLQQSDGKIIYVGSAGLIVRYNTDGTKDSSFNQVGFRNLIGNTYNIQSVILQSDNKILVGGINIVTRLNTDGTTDSTFNANGIRTINSGSFPFNIKSLDIQSDGKILIAGYVSNGTNNDFGIARLNPDGSFDTTFDSDGIKTIAIGTGNDQAFTVKIQSDNKIVLGGDTFNGTKYNYAVARLNTDGSLDSTFNLTGKVTTSLSTSNDYGRKLIIDFDQIVLLGASNNNLALVRYNSNGVLDSNLSGTGKLIMSLPISLTTISNNTNPHVFPKIYINPQGRYVISCTTSSDFKVLQLNYSGSLYNTFGGGTGMVQINNQNDTSSILFRKSNGSIVTGGTSSSPTTGGLISEVELNNSTGAIINNLERRILDGQNITDLIVQMNDGGYLCFVRSAHPKLVKYTSSGSIDTSFGINGVFDFNDYGGLNKAALTRVINNKIYVSLRNLLYKLNIDGTPDLSFNGTGMIDTSLMTSYEIFEVNTFIVLNNGKIIIANEGYNSSTSSYLNSFLKINSDGTIDNSFGTTGILKKKMINDPNYTYREYPWSSYLTNDNKIIIISDAENVNLSNRKSILCFKMDEFGNNDTTFGNNGMIHIVEPYDLVHFKGNLNANNDLFIGFSYINGDTSTIKVKPNGTIDLALGVNGYVNDLTDGIYLSVFPLIDGSFIKAGIRNNHFSTLKYLSNGVLDLSFGNNGEIVTPIDDSSEIRDVIVDQNGKIVVAGKSNLNSVRSYNALARYELNLGILSFENNFSNIKLYPNPIENEAKIDFELKQNEILDIFVYDIQGRVVQTIVSKKEFNLGNNSINFVIGSTLKTGNYFVKINSNQGSKVIQILKQ